MVKCIAVTLRLPPDNRIVPGLQLAQQMRDMAGARELRRFAGGTRYPRNGAAPA